jgi:hypothetical protein
VHVAGEYEVCWCAFDCATTGTWHKVGTVDVEGPRYEWEVQPSGKLHISAPPFTALSAASTWETKLLEPNYWRCENSAAPWTAGVDVGADVISLDVDSTKSFRICVRDGVRGDVLVSGPKREMLVRGALAGAGNLRNSTWDVTRGLPFELVVQASVGSVIDLCGSNTLGVVVPSTRGRVVRGEAWPDAAGEVCADGDVIGIAVSSTTTAVQQVFVVEAGQEASLEVHGRGLRPGGRISILRDGDVCGVHAPPPEVDGHLKPLLSKSVEAVSDINFARVVDSFFPGANLPAPDHVGCSRCAPKATLVRDYTILADRPDLAYEDKVSADPLCAGYLDGDEGGTAICAGEATCRQLCLESPACLSVDVHNELPRCFLNSDAPSLPNVMRSNAYSILVKSQAAVPSRLEGVHSTSTRLIFPLRVPVGEFKACFCDGGCASAKDYSLEVGRIIASGVSCLIGQSHHGCTNMTHGGLMCSTAVLPEVTGSP